jgi:hypothetical protein
MAIDPFTGLPDNNIQNKDGTISYPSPVIDAPKIGTTPTVTVPSPVTVPDTTYTSAVNTVGSSAQASQDAIQAEQEAQAKLAQSQGIANDVSRLESQLGGKSADTANLYSTAGGVNDAYKQLKDLNAQAIGLKNEASAIPIQTPLAYQGTAATQQTINSVNRDKLSQNALKALSLGQQAAIAQGNFDVAKNLADQQIEVKYSQLEADLRSKQTQLAALDKYSLTPAQDKAKEALARKYKLQDQEIADKKAQDKDAQALSYKVAGNLASTGMSQDKISRIMNSITNAKSFNDMVIASAPYLESASDKADISYKIAQTAKIYNDIRESARTNGSNIDPSQSLAYAQEYAATGKIPTGIPKGGFGTVSQWAKELPKQNGEIISTATGVHPGQDSTYADALSSLSSVVKLAQDLKIQDKNRIGGLVGGTLGAITGSEAQGNYLSTRSQIVDLLSRARSGAALTENEVKTYENMIPGRFSEPLGIGQNSDVKIQQFVDAITKDMQNKAAAKGWSIYGVSKVKPQGADHEYTVGDLIHANGQTGRVNADGSITIVQ